jgi:hypothetical protein
VKEGITVFISLFSPPCRYPFAERQVVPKAPWEEYVKVRGGMHLNS